MTAPVRILLVEDSPVDAELVIAALRTGGLAATVVRVDTEADMRAALARGGWDAVLSDWQLPGFGALAALALVRAAQLDVPFVIISGTIGEELAADAMRAGAHDYVLKDHLLRLAPAIERELREHALRRARVRQDARFRAVIEKSVEAVLLIDARGLIAYASPACAALFGRAPAAIVGAPAQALVHADDAVAFAAALARVSPGESAPSTEWRLASPDGTPRWAACTATNLLADPEVEAIVVNVRDRTESRRAASALRASEARFARLAESGIIGILMADARGQILEANDAYLAMIGYTRDDLRAGAIDWHALTPLDVVATTLAVATHLERDGFIRPWETVVLRKDGTRVPVLTGVAVLAYPVCIVFCADLTERKRAEAALRTSEEHLRQAQKMEAVGRLAGGVAHDFNNVLSVVLSYAEMLVADLEPGDPKRDDLEQIHAAARRAADLTRQLLMFSRQQVLEPRALDLGEVLAGMDKMLRRVLGPEIELVTRYAPQLGAIHADPSSVEQVIMNLVVNARDAMPRGGRLVIATAEEELDAAAAERCGLAPGPHIVLRVTDTGTGMDAATRARIFEPFFTTKARDKGTGLGLSTVLGIVQHAGGAIAAHSEPGHGTTFEIHLPRSAAAAEPASARASAPVHGSETILLVEDDPLVRSAARGALARFGYLVLDARSPSDALARCAAHEGEIHLLLTDVVMPLMAGPKLALRAQALRPGLRVLFMSGYTDDSILRHGVTSASIAFLQKPFTRESLARKVREVLDAPAVTIGDL